MGKVVVGQNLGGFMITQSNVTPQVLREIFRTIHAVFKAECLFTSALNGVSSFESECLQYK